MYKEKQIPGHALFKTASKMYTATRINMYLMYVKYYTLYLTFKILEFLYLCHLLTVEHIHARFVKKNYLIVLNVTARKMTFIMNSGKVL